MPIRTKQTQRSSDSAHMPDRRRRHRRDRGVSSADYLPDHVTPARRTWLQYGWILKTAIGCMIIMVIFGFYTVPSGSMEPTLHVGDTFIGVRRVAGLPSLHRGDVIVFKDDAGWMNGEPSQGERLVKRLIGLPGDTVSSTDGLNLYVNGHLIHEPQIKTSADGRIVFNVKVTSGHLFVLGDNRGNSSDSRYHLTEHHGLIRESSVEAILLLRIRPVTNITTVKGLHDVYEQ